MNPIQQDLERILRELKITDPQVDAILRNVYLAGVAATAHFYSTQSNKAEANVEVVRFIMTNLKAPTANPGN